MHLFWKCHIIVSLDASFILYNENIVPNIVCSFTDLMCIAVVLIFPSQMAFELGPVYCSKLRCCFYLSEFSP